MNYFDSHAHYDDKRFKQDREELLRELLPSCGVSNVINVGCDVKSSEMSIHLAEKYDYIYAAVGVHPHELYDMSSQTIAKLKKLSEHKKVVAIGEIGLDYYYDTHPKELQRFWFRQQLRLAEETNLPVIIHSRDASQETFDIIKASSVRRGSIHCYSGSAQMALDYVKMGFSIGVGGVVTCIFRTVLRGLWKPLRQSLWKASSLKQIVRTSHPIRTAAKETTPQT